MRIKMNKNQTFRKPPALSDGHVIWCELLSHKKKNIRDCQLGCVFTRSVRGCVARAVVVKEPIESLHWRRQGKWSAPIGPRYATPDIFWWNIALVSHSAADKTCDFYTILLRKNKYRYVEFVISGIYFLSVCVTWMY